MTECNASLGMGDGRIEDTQLSASSYSNYYPGSSNQNQQLALSPRLGRLNGAYAWCSQVVPALYMPYITLYQL